MTPLCRFADAKFYNNFILTLLPSNKRAIGRNELKLCNCQLVSNVFRIAKVRIAKVRRAKVRTTKVRRAKVRIAKVRRAKVRIAKVRRAKVRRAKVRRAKVRRAKVRIAKVRIAKANFLLNRIQYRVSQRNGSRCKDYRVVNVLNIH